MKRYPRPRADRRSWLVCAALALVCAVSLPATPAFGASGNIFVSQFNGKKTKAKSFTEPSALATNAAGDIFVFDQEAVVIDEFPPGGGVPLVEFNATATPSGTFQTTGIAVNATGDLFVADFAGRVVDEFNPAGEYVSQITGAHTKAGFYKPSAVAIDSQGHIFVADQEHEVVDEFSADGSTLLAELTGRETQEKRFRQPEALAINASDDLYVSTIGDETEASRVYELDPAGKLLRELDVGETPQPLGNAIAIATASDGDVYVASTGSGVVDRFSGTTGGYLSQFDGSKKHSQAFEPIALAVNPSDEVYVSYAESEAGVDFVDLFSKATPAIAPTGEISSVSAVTSHATTVEGVVNPEGYATKYHLEYSSDGVNWSSTLEATVGAGATDVPFSQTITGLNGNTTYRVRVVAASAAGANTSAESTFTTLLSAAQVFGVGVGDITSTVATLHATVFPEGQPAASYRFEYGTTAAYGMSAPAGGEGSVATTPAQVSQSIGGLQPATTYHFRVVASNGIGTPVATHDQTFTTSDAPSCPNEGQRAEGSLDPLTSAPYALSLPDCRAYEQVTPVFKDGATVEVSPSFSTAGLQAISNSGSTGVASSSSLWGTPAGAEEASFSIGTTYGVVRDASGWNVAPANPRASELPFASRYLSSASDPRTGVWLAATPFQPEEASTLYLRGAGGAFTEVGPVGPASATAGGALRGANPGPPLQEPYEVQASSDLSRVLFTMHAPDRLHLSLLWPGDHTSILAGGIPSLYEYVGAGHTGEGEDVPALVGLDNEGTQISQCGTALGAGFEGSSRDARNAVSATGSTVFFTAQPAGCAIGAIGPPVAQLYARIGAPGSPQGTVNVAATGGCEASASCNVEAPVTYAGASSDGSKVFFTSAQALLPEDSNTTADLYECELPGDQGSAPAPTGTVDPCPHLRLLTATGTGSGVDVQSVVAISEAGSRVYFTATAALTSTPNDQGRAAQAGRTNLYLWEASSESRAEPQTSFVATLPEGHFANDALAGEGVQATPDGAFLVFGSSGDLTLDDTSAVAQVFRYDSLTGELTRVSSGQGGFNDDGNTETDPAALPHLVEQGGIRERGTAISDDGSYVVFQSSDALTPQVHGGLNNVYEWHDGTVSLISDGLDSYSPATAEGTPEHAVGLIGMDASGSNVFFTTRDRLVGQDSDESVDVYDARIDGGFPAPKSEAGCSGEACQGPLPLALSSAAIGSTAKGAQGNVLAFATQGTPAAAKLQVAGHSLKAGELVLSVKSPAKGTIGVSGSGLHALRRVVEKPGVYTLKVKLNASERRLLNRKHKLELRLRLSFKPTAGTASSLTLSFTFARRVARKH